MEVVGGVVVIVRMRVAMIVRMRVAMIVRMRVVMRHRQRPFAGVLQRRPSRAGS
jgi:hypothetical protein